MQDLSGFHPRKDRSLTIGTSFSSTLSHRNRLLESQLTNEQSEGVRITREG
jgi:hypothetical protein